MHSSALRRFPRAYPAFALAGLAAVACAATVLPSLAGSFGGPRYEKHGYLHCIRSGEDIYSFDPVWRVESFRTVDGATGLDADGPVEGARVDRLRRALLRRLGARDLSEIPSEGAAEVNAIRALGYI